jgi:competence protein ComEA
MKRAQWMAPIVAVVCAAGPAAAGVEGPRAKPEGTAASHADARPGNHAAPKVNINEASKAELMKLDGVGASAADRILSYRQAHGPFKRAQDLEKVDKVGRAVLERNPGRIVVK